MSALGDAMEVEFVVVGSGMAGMTAAALVASRGGRVAVIEKAAELGGNSALSGGWVWTAPRPDVLVIESPSADPSLIETLCDGYPSLMAWIESTGAEVGGEAVVLDYGRGRPVDLVGYFDACRATVEAAGGCVLPRTQMYQLHTDPSGAVAGVDALSAGRELALRAPWTLLASGGFQADAELITKYIHPQAPTMPLRASRASTGDALTAALAVGAATSESMDGFYGHLVSWPSDVWTPGVFTLLSQYHSHRAALVNVRGELSRPPFESDHYNTQWTLKQPEARAIMVFDQLLYADQGSPISVGDRRNSFDVAASHGAHAASAPTIAALAEAVAPWGYDTSTWEAVVAEVNREAASSPGARQPIVAAPFYALEVRPAITFTHGGLRIDPDAHVLDTSGTPIGGLLAAGADAGGVHAGGYGGGLATAGVFGMRAAATVISSLELARA